MHKRFFVVAALLSFSAAVVWFSSVSSSSGQSATPRVIEISAKKYEFTPHDVHVKKGEKVELKVHSEDETHGAKLDLFPAGSKDKSSPGLVFDHPDENGKVSKGVDQLLDFTAQTPGSYDFKCAKICGMGHGRMKGTLIVDP
jgi:cytochrome c oxidase subunit 2